MHLHVLQRSKLYIPGKVINSKEERLALPVEQVAGDHVPRTLW